MNKYLVLYLTDAAAGGMTAAKMFANSTPEQIAAGMGAWQAWHEKAASAVTDLGAPLDKATAISGQATPIASPITGYSILQADSMDAAVALMQNHPHFHAPGASIHIFEAVKIPGM